ncbi:MAG: bifunctional glutamate N-acetyltransferase/amino-acid acetyltransferase ArgJ [Halanaerobacter sp.]
MNVKEIEGTVTTPLDFFASGIETGVKEEGKDMALIYSIVESEAAAVFTENQAQAAPVRISRNHLEDNQAQAILVNSGNANACTGERGNLDAAKMIELAGQKLGLDQDDIILCSTGIIGEYLEMDKIKPGIEKAVLNLKENGGVEAAEAILTTDKYQKELAVKVDIGGEEITIGGIAKGSGMIEPSMATMLSFLTTDAGIDKRLLQEALSKAVDKTFNRITVDGDQSTNDTVAILANGAAENEVIEEKDDSYQRFVEGLSYICKELAHLIVKDGEGATKFITIEAEGVESEAKAVKIAKGVANSNLVKTAIFGEDPNWGRIASAAGSVGVEFELDKLEIRINGQDIFGPAQQIYNYADDLLEESTVKIEVDLNSGEESAQVWTCDLSYKYVEINAEYHT